MYIYLGVKIVVGIYYLYYHLFTYKYPYTYYYTCYYTNYFIYSHAYLGAKMVVGMPFKDIATSDSIYLSEVPLTSDSSSRKVGNKRKKIRCMKGR